MNVTWTQDYTALVLAYVYVFGVIALAELLRRMGKRPVDFTRKFIHIGVGMWVVPTALLFETWYMALIPPATFVVINTISYFRGTFGSMETGDRGDLGTIFFPISFLMGSRFQPVRAGLTKPPPHVNFTSFLHLLILFSAHPHCLQIQSRIPFPFILSPGPSAIILC